MCIRHNSHALNAIDGKGKGQVRASSSQSSHTHLVLEVRLYYVFALTSYKYCWRYRDFLSRQDGD